MRQDTESEIVLSARELSDRLCGSSSVDPLWVDETATTDRQAPHHEVGWYLDLLATSGVRPGEAGAARREGPDGDLGLQVRGTIVRNRDDKE